MLTLKGKSVYIEPKGASIKTYSLYNDLQYIDTIDYRMHFQTDNGVLALTPMEYDDLCKKGYHSSNERFLAIHQKN